MIARVPVEVRPEIQHALGSLKARIRTYVVMEGIALVVALVGIAFWLSLGVDYFYFWISKLELPVWFRAGYVYATAAAGVLAFCTWVLLRLMKNIRSKALALVLERRFPELNDRLITAVEVAESKTGRESAITISMLERTIADVAIVTQKLDVGEVFNKTPVRRAVTTAIVMLSSILIFSVANAEAFQRWANAFLGWHDSYWVRETDLVARVIAQPGDRVKDFRDSNGNSTAGRPGVYKHPRGGDLTIVIEVPTPEELIVRQERVATRTGELLDKVTEWKKSEEARNANARKEAAGDNPELKDDATDPESSPKPDETKPDAPGTAPDESSCDETPDSDVDEANPVSEEPKADSKPETGEPSDTEPAGAEPKPSRETDMPTVPDGNEEHVLAFRKLKLEQLQIKRELVALPAQLSLSKSQLATITRAVEQFDGEISKAEVGPLNAAHTMIKEHLTGENWVVPDRVRLDYELEGGSSNRVFIPVAERQYKYTISALQDDLTFWFKGNDYATREVYRVKVVDPPKVDSMVLAAKYPEYTGLNETEPPLLHVQGTEVQLPEETKFAMRAESNKTLTKVRIQSDAFEITMTPMSHDGVGLAQLVLFENDDHALREFALPDDMLYRFRRFNDEKPIHVKLKEAVSRLALIESQRDSSDKVIAKGAVDKLSPDNVATVVQHVTGAQKLAADAAAAFGGFTSKLNKQPTALVEFLNTNVKERLDDAAANGFKPLLDELGKLSSADDVEVQRSVCLATALKLERRLDGLLYKISDGSQFQLDFALTDKAVIDDGVTDEGLIPLAPNQALRVYLEDTDDIIAAEPSHLRINGIVDGPPTFDNVSRRGIGDVITRKARIPYKGIIRDDYGIEDARFHYKIDGEPDWQSRRFFNSPSDSPTEFFLQRNDETPFEYFEVLPLDLRVGQELTLTVFAEDGDNLNGPHTSRTQEFKCKIVTAEELLRLLYIREIERRKQFEQIIKEVDESRQLLVETRFTWRELNEPGEVPEDESSKEETDRKKQKLNSTPDRLLAKIAKNKGECEGVQQEFRDILDELVNNGVHTEAMVERIDELIVQRLNDINTKDFEEVDGALRLFKRSLDATKNDDPETRIADGLEQYNLMLIHMRQVLSEMQDLAEFHEAITNLKKIITDQKDVIQDTENEATKNAIEKLKGLQGLDGDKKDEKGDKKE